MTKLGFLFLTYDNLSCPELWNSFFKKAPTDKYKILCHAKNPERVKDFLKDYLTKEQVETRWGTYLLVKATFVMLKEMSQDEDITHFLLVSHDTIPLVDFETIYKTLSKEPRGFINIAQSAKKYYSRHSQWLILPKSFVKEIIPLEIKLYFEYFKYAKDITVTSKASRVCDESWISIAMRKFFSDKRFKDYFCQTDNSKTYVNFIDIKSRISQPRYQYHYYEKEFTNYTTIIGYSVPEIYTVEESQKMKSELIKNGYWFMRKVYPENLWLP